MIYDEFEVGDLVRVMTVEEMKIAMPRNIHPFQDDSHFGSFIIPDMGVCSNNVYRIRSKEYSAPTSARISDCAPYRYQLEDCGRWKFRDYMLCPVETPAADWSQVWEKAYE